jgi:hypothetical protein
MAFRGFSAAMAGALLAIAGPALANSHRPQPPLSHESLDDLENHIGLIGLIGIIGLFGLRRDRRH